MSTAAGEGASWFSHSGGIKSIAQAGSQTIQANTDALEILADQSITVTSSNDEIHILAKEKIVLQAGQSSVSLEGQNITFACPGKFSVKGSGAAFLGPGKQPAELDILPSSLVEPGQHDQFFVLRNGNSGDPVKNRRFRIRRADGSLQQGVTDVQGRSSLLDSATKSELLSLNILPEA